MPRKFLTSTYLKKKHMATENNSQSMLDLLSPERRKALINIFGDKYAKQFMGPIAFIDGGKLSSPTAINFFNRDFPFISRVLNYEYQYRSWNGFDQSLLDRYSELITKKLASITVLLENWNNRFGKLLEQNGVKVDGAVYSNAITMSVPIISGHARGYYMVLQSLDQLNLIAGTANLYGVINATQRAEAEFMCKKAVRAFSAALRNEVVRIYREADRLMRDQKGEVDPSKRAAHAEQGKELNAFSSAIGPDGADGEDPSKVIDEVAAATAAASQAESSKAPGKKAAKKATAAEAA